jgi:hypothetical protein
MNTSIFRCETTISKITGFTPIQINRPEDFLDFFTELDFQDESVWFALFVNFGTKENMSTFFIKDYCNNPDILRKIRRAFDTGKVSFMVSPNVYFSTNFNKIHILGNTNSHIISTGRSSTVSLEGDSCEAIVKYGEAIKHSGANQKIELYDSDLYIEDYFSCEDINSGALVKAYGHSRVFLSKKCGKDNSFCLYDYSFLHGYVLHGPIDLYDFSIAVIEECGAETITLHDFSTLDARAASGELNIVYDSVECRYLTNDKYAATSLEEVIDFCNKYKILYDLNNRTALFYKAVHHDSNGCYCSNFDDSFTYKIGEVVSISEIESNRNETCGCGIHVAPFSYAKEFGKYWHDIAILELEVNMDEILIPYWSDGKVRVSKARVIREVSEDEWPAMEEYETYAKSSKIYFLT